MAGSPISHSGEAAKTAGHQFAIDAHWSWKKKIIVRRYCKELPAEAPCELDCILRILEAEKNAVPPFVFAETPNTKLFAVIEAELDHRIQFVSETSFGHIQLDEMRVGYDRRGRFSVQAWHKVVPLAARQCSQRSRKARFI
jgi:hypothetical protein